MYMYPGGFARLYTAAVHNQKYDMVSFSPLLCLGKYVDKVGIVLRVTQCFWEHSLCKGNDASNGIEETTEV